MALSFGKGPSVFGSGNDDIGLGQAPLSYGINGFSSAPPTLAPPAVPQPGMGVGTMGGSGMGGGLIGPTMPKPGTAPSAGMRAWTDRTQIGQMFHNQDGTFNWGAVGSAAQAVGGLGQLYLGFQANKQAQEEFQYMKGITDKNMANQIKDFNKAVEDQSYSRAAQNNAAAGTAEAYIDKHKL